MKNVGTDLYDELLKSKIMHYTNYPEMLPFIGSNWIQSKGVLLIGESHYLPFAEINKIEELKNVDYFTNWYNLNSEKLGWLKDYITTRKNFETVKFGSKKSKPLSLYYNLQKAIKDVGYLEQEQFEFDKFSFYNFYQKPANVNEIKGENRSFNSTKEDNEFAFDTFLKVIKIIKPKNVIFVSKKSYDAFNEMRILQKMNFDNIMIDFVPHAGRQWWNRKSKVYGNRTGKQKFIDILKSCYE